MQACVYVCLVEVWDAGGLKIIKLKRYPGITISLDYTYAMARVTYSLFEDITEILNAKNFLGLITLCKHKLNSVFFL